MTCTPSLHKTDCSEVSHDCRVLRRCYDELQSDFSNLKSRNFDCQEPSYSKPKMFPIVTPQFFVIGGLNSTLIMDDTDLSNSVCSSSYPNLVMFFKHKHAFCKEKVLSPESNCRRFIGQCHGLLACLSQKRSRCAPILLTGTTKFFKSCHHWSAMVKTVNAYDDGRMEAKCVSHVIPTGIKNQCDYQNKICGIIGSCLSQRSCSLRNLTQIDFSISLQKKVRQENDLIVHYCNSVHGHSAGISLSFRAWKWICDTSIRSFSLSCVEVLDTCNSIARCLVDDKERPTYIG